MNVPSTGLCDLALSTDCEIVITWDAQLVAMS
jgi:hypothetical protein